MKKNTEPMTTTHASRSIEPDRSCDAIDETTRHGVVMYRRSLDKKPTDSFGSTPIRFAANPAAIIANITATLINTSPMP